MNNRKNAYRARKKSHQAIPRNYDQPSSRTANNFLVLEISKLKEKILRQKRMLRYRNELIVDLKSQIPDENYFDDLKDEIDKRTAAMTHVMGLVKILFVSRKLSKVDTNNLLDSLHNFRRF